MDNASESVRKNLPYVTIGLIAANIIYFIITVLGGNPSNVSYMLSRGAVYAPYVFEEHQYWRLLTGMFMHFSFRHMAGNMVYLGIVGATYENITGHMKFFLIYMLSGFGGNVVSCAYHQLSGHSAVSAGASGAVYGVIGIVVYLTFISVKKFDASKLFLRIAIMLVFMFYSNFLSGDDVDVAAHIGGLFFGVLLSLLFLPYKNKDKDRKY